MVISKTIEIDMGHRLPNHKSKCHNLHGHRYKYEVIVNGDVITAEGVSSQGMVIDFSDLKTVMMEIIDARLDHGFMIAEVDPYLPFFKQAKEEGQKIIIVDYIPTVENIAKDVFKRLAQALVDYNIKLESLRVWETPTSMAHITREDL